MTQFEVGKERLGSQPLYLKNIQRLDPSVTTPDGTAYRRNRRLLQSPNEAPPVITGPAYDDPVAPVVAFTHS